MAILNYPNSFAGYATSNKPNPAISTLIPKLAAAAAEMTLARPFKAGKNDQPSVRVTAVTLDFTRR